MKSSITISSICLAVACLALTPSPAFSESRSFGSSGQTYSNYHPKHRNHHNHYAREYSNKSKKLMMRRNDWRRFKRDQLKLARKKYQAKSRRHLKGVYSQPHLFGGIIPISDRNFNSYTPQRNNRKTHRQHFRKKHLNEHLYYELPFVKKF